MKVKTGKVRMSYVNVFTPRAAVDGGQAKYGVCLLIPKDDKNTLDRMQKAIEAAYEEGKAKHKLPKNYKSPLRDGDAERPDSPEYENMMFVNANSHRKPGLVDQNVQPIMDQSEFYSGCWGRATLNFFPFSASVNKGIACGLNNLQKLEDGERLGGGSTAEQDFGEDEDDMMS